MILTGTIKEVIADEYERLIFFDIGDKIITFTFMDPRSYCEEIITLREFSKNDISLSVQLISASLVLGKKVEVYFEQPIHRKPHTIIKGLVKSGNSDEFIVLNECYGEVFVELINEGDIKVNQNVLLKGELVSEDPLLEEILPSKL